MNTSHNNSNVDKTSIIPHSNAHLNLWKVKPVSSWLVENWCVWSTSLCNWKTAWNLHVFYILVVKYFWPHLSLSSFHRNKGSPASYTVLAV